MAMRLAAALGIGLLVGLERGWRTRDEEGGQRTAGFRTFALAGLLGGIAAALGTLTDPIVIGFIFLGFIGAWTALAWLEARADKNYSVTGVVAGALTFALGAYAVLGDLNLAIAAAVVAASLLALREQLHRWVASLRWEEIRAGLILLAMTFLLLPVLPREPVDPWGVLNLFEIWLFAVLIAAVSFGGYVAVRFFGDRLGVIMAALAGGLASSTATTMSLARLGRARPESSALLSAGILLAGVVMTVRVGIVAALLNPALIEPLAGPIAGLALGLGLSALTLLLTRRDDGAAMALGITNPLELGAALRLAALIGAVTIAAELVRRLIGSTAVLAVAAVSGVVDVDAVTISLARQADAMGIGIAALGIAIAVGINTASKVAIALFTGGRAIGLRVAAGSAAGVLLAGLGWYLFP